MVKHLKLASLVSAVFRQRHVELVVVGGSAIEFYTEGQYMSGDIDMCLVSPTRLDIRTRQTLMSQLGGKGGPRSWQAVGPGAKWAAALLPRSSVDLQVPAISVCGSFSTADVACLLRKRTS